MSFLLTILTPTYNRASLLPRLYKSLCAQTCQDFEWIVVDDGSTDGTSKLFSAGAGMQSTVALRYVRKTNGGKHTAVNSGVREARGVLTLILDSDDELPPGAVAAIEAAWKRVEGLHRQDIGGLGGYMAHRNGKRIGTPVVSGLYSSLALRYEAHVSGDMCEVFRTDVLRDHPFPEVSGERFCPEALVWNRIAREYPLYVIPDILYLRDYLDGGLTANIVRIRMQSPRASMLTYAELTTCRVPFAVKVKAAINYWRFWYCRRADTLVPPIARRWYGLRPVGWMMHRRDVVDRCSAGKGFMPFHGK